MSELETAIKQMAGTYQSDTVGMVLCTVVSVNEDERTCEVKTVNSKSEINYTGVQLMAGVNDGMLLIPTVDSQVYISFSKVNTPFVSMFSQLDKVLFVVGEMDIQVTEQGIELNGSNYGGIVKVGELVDKINTIERDINKLKLAFSTWVTVPNDGGAALKAAAATWYAAQLAITTESELENTTLSHGNE